MSRAGQELKQVLLHVAKRIQEQKDYLCELDSDVGDGDHGVSMTIGMRAAARQLGDLEDPSPAEAFRAVSDAFADEVGASIGPLYEEAFLAASRAVEGAPVALDATSWAKVVTAMSEAVQRVGGARVGDKTLVDAWQPAADELADAARAGETPDKALRRAAQVAWKNVESTKDLVPKLGRASRLGERARGHPDAGASSASLILEAFAEGMESSQR